MRWEALFGDLEAQFEQAEAAQLSAEVADRTRRELARIRLVDRLRAALGRQLTCAVAGDATISGRLLDVGADWLLLSDGSIREALVSLPAVMGLTGLGPWASEPGSEGSVAKRLDLRYVLRALARDRSGVSCLLTDGSRVTGTLDRVGADFVDLAEHALDEPRRPAAVRAVRSIPLGALALIRHD